MARCHLSMTKAFLAVEGNTAAASRRVHEAVEQLTGEVFAALTRRIGEGRTFHIEDVQDQVELALMRSEHHKVARAYVLYREERARRRAEEPLRSPLLFRLCLRSMSRCQTARACRSMPHAWR
jgi:ribonucleoside-diphosphate reductase alpha chain